MSPTHQGFNQFLAEFEQKLQQAGKHKNPALYLYKQGARTPIFMLEGLAKLYAGIQQPKRFSKMKARFKALEDALGAIDYYDVLRQELAAYNKIPTSVHRYLEAQKREKIQYLNEVLVEEKWIGSPTPRLEKIKAKLADARWLEPVNEVAAIKDFYGEAIYDIKQFLAEQGGKFDDIEHDVHELRRQLRWLSIYPQALRGIIQLGSQANELPKSLFTPYHTKAILQSPFNQMPAAGDASHILLLDRDRFLCLSWLIAELGRLKDIGLREFGLAEALLETEAVDTMDAACAQSLKLLGKKQPPSAALLEQAFATVTRFMSEQHLEYLVMGTARVMGSVE